jgi:hypothetical protein
MNESQRFYVIGSSREKRWFRVLKIDRSEPSELNVSEDPVWYSLQEVKSLLQRIDEGNRATGGLTFVTKAYGIAGPFPPSSFSDRYPAQFTRHVTDFCCARLDIWISIGNPSPCQLLLVQISSLDMVRYRYSSRIADVLFPVDNRLLIGTAIAYILFLKLLAHIFPTDHSDPFAVVSQHRLHKVSGVLLPDSSHQAASNWLHLWARYILYR